MEIVNNLHLTKERVKTNAEEVVNKYKELTRDYWSKSTSIVFNLMKQVIERE